MSISFGRVVQSLLEKTLKIDFDVASYDVILAHTSEDDFEMANIKFTNGQQTFSSITVLKPLLFARVIRSLFAYYLEKRLELELSDEPENCDDLTVFRNHVCNFTWFMPIFHNYFNIVIVPVFNSRISDRLISLFGDKM